jgi:hypothetical protein
MDEGELLILLSVVGIASMLVLGAVTVVSYFIIQRRSRRSESPQTGAAASGGK